MHSHGFSCTALHCTAPPQERAQADSARVHHHWNEVVGLPCQHYRTGQDWTGLYRSVQTAHSTGRPVEGAALLTIPGRPALALALALALQV